MKERSLLALALLAFPAMGFAETVDISSYDELLSYADQTENPSQGTVLRVAADFSTPDNLLFLLTDELTIDLNGHTITLDGDLAISGTGTLKITDSTAEQNGTIISTWKWMFVVSATSTLNIEGGNFISETDRPYPLIDILYPANVEINGGHFISPTLYNIIDNQSTLVINGGTFEGAGRYVVRTIGYGVTSITDGAFYAGNKTHGNCFDNVPDYEEEAIPELILPEGVIDGGAVVLSEQWAIPGTYYINYALPQGTVMQPGNHYYYPGDEFTLPECDRNQGTPFAGWSESPDNDTALITEITAETAQNFQLYPVWKYVNLPSGVSPTLRSVSTNPEGGSTHEQLASLTLSFTSGEEMDLYLNEEMAAAACVQKVNYGIPKTYCGVTLSPCWDGTLTVEFEQPVTAIGDYRIYIPVGAVGDSDYEYGDYQEGKCNPDIFVTFTINNNQASTKGMNVTPADSTTVDSLKEIRFIFEDSTVMYEYDKEMSLTDSEGNILQTLTYMECGYDGDDVLLTLPEEITAPGVYHLEIPFGFFAYEWGEDPIAATTYTWIVSNENSVADIKASDVESTEYFDPSGRRLQAPSKGIMIVKQTLRDGTTRRYKVCN